MRLNSVETGYPRIFRDKDSFAWTPGQAFEIPFDTVPVMYSGRAISIRAVEIGFPDFTVDVGAGKVLDAVSFSQLITQIGLRLSPDAPNERVGRPVIEDVDGFRALLGLSFLTDESCWKMDKARQFSDAAGGDPAVTTRRAVRNPRGWPQDQGPYATAGAAQTISGLTLRLPIGYGAHGPDRFAHIIPAPYFRGEGGCGCAGSVPGRINMTVGSTIDGHAVTWPATPKLSMRFDALVHSPGVSTVPLIPHIVAYQKSDSEFFARSGVRGFLGIVKALVAGDQVDTAYLEAMVQIAGLDLYDKTLAIVRRQWNDYCGNEWSMDSDDRWSVPETQVILTHADKVRLAKVGEMFLFGRGRISQSVGSITDRPFVRILNAPTETVHQVLDVTRTPRTGEYNEQAAKFAFTRGVMTTAAANAGKIEGQIAQALPGVIKA